MIRSGGTFVSYASGRLTRWRPSLRRSGQRSNSLRQLTQSADGRIRFDHDLLLLFTQGIGGATVAANQNRRHLRRPRHPFLSQFCGISVAISAVSTRWTAPARIAASFNRTCSTGSPPLTIRRTYGIHHGPTISCFRCADGERWGDASTGEMRWRILGCGPTDRFAFDLNGTRMARRALHGGIARHHSLYQEAFISSSRF